MRTGSCLSLPLCVVWTTVLLLLLLLLILSYSVDGFQGAQQQSHRSHFQIHYTSQGYKLSTTLSQRRRGCSNPRIHLSASTQNQDAPKPNHVNGDASSSSSAPAPTEDHENLQNELRVAVNEMELNGQEENGVEPSEVPWSYWSTGSQLVQAGAVGATTGLLVAIFKLVRAPGPLLCCSILKTTQTCFPSQSLFSSRLKPFDRFVTNKIFG